MSESAHKPRLYPLVWLLITLLAMYVLDRWLPVAGLLPQPFHRLGLVFMVPGILIVLHSGASFLKAKTGLLPFSEATTLVTGGLFRYTRNPMYLGMVLFPLGVALYLGSLSALIPVAAYTWIIDRLFIRNEEVFLTETFGDEFEEYMKRVRRWI